MKVICVDDEKIALESILYTLNEIEEVTEKIGFRSPEKCLEYLEENSADAAFLDISMRKMNGLALAKLIKEKRPEIYIIFLTGYSEYALQAFKLHASGYLLKPASTEDIQEELANIKNEHSNYDTKKRIRIQTFGNFEVFADEKPIPFIRSKSKEVLAYLVDRKGAKASLSEIAGILWEDGMYDRSRQKQMQCFISDLVKSLKAVHAEEILVKDRTGIMIMKDLVDCDYFRFLEGDAKAVNAYMGEYMSSYYWGEFTIGALDSKIYGDE